MGLRIDRKSTIKTTTDGVELLAMTYTIPDDSVATFRLDVRAIELATGNAAFMSFTGGFKRAGAGDAEVMTLVPANPPAAALAENVTDLEGQSKDVAAWDSSVELSGEGILMKIQGEADKTIEWNVRLQIDTFSPLT